MDFLIVCVAYILKIHLSIALKWSISMLSELNFKKYRKAMMILKNISKETQGKAQFVRNGSNLAN